MTSSDGDPGQQIETLSIEVEALRGRLENAELERDLLRAERDNLLASTSWRVSAPVRWLGHLVKRIVGRRHILYPAKLVDIEDLGFGRYRATDIRPFVLLESRSEEQKSELPSLMRNSYAVF